MAQVAPPSAERVVIQFLLFALAVAKTRPDAPIVTLQQL